MKLGKLLLTLLVVTSLGATMACRKATTENIEPGQEMTQPMGETQPTEEGTTQPMPEGTTTTPETTEGTTGQQ